MEQDEKKGFVREASEAVKKNILTSLEADRKRDHEDWALKNWRSWGSWFSWGSPVGLGLFIISIGVFLLLLHYSGIIR